MIQSKTDRILPNLICLILSMDPAHFPGTRPNTRTLWSYMLGHVHIYTCKIWVYIYLFPCNKGYSVHKFFSCFNKNVSPLFAPTAYSRLHALRVEWTLLIGSNHVKNRPRDATNKLGNFASIERGEGSIGIGKWDIFWVQRFIPCCHDAFSQRQGSWFWLRKSR